MSTSQEGGDYGSKEARSQKAQADPLLWAKSKGNLK